MGNLQLLKEHQKKDQTFIPKLFSIDRDILNT